MVKADKTVLRETAYIAFWVFIFSLVMQLVFIIADRWDYTVLLGNLWGASMTVLNFFFMGISIQKAVMVEDSDARKIIKTSQTVRMLFLFIWVVAGAALSCFSTIAIVIPLLFPRVAIALRPLWKDKQNAKENAR